MKIILNKKYFSEAPERFLTARGGYLYIYDKHTGKESYVKELSRNRYPRFHIYLKYEKDKVIIDLHIDQKKASYQGARMHNAEHDSEVVENEVRRLKTLIMAQVPSGSIERKNNEKNEEKDAKKHSNSMIGQGNFKKDGERIKDKEKKSFWRRLLGN